MRSNSASVTFKSDMLCELTIDWQKVSELQAADRFAVLEKDIKLGKHEGESRIPHGTLSVADQTLLLKSAPNEPPRRIPVGDTVHVVDETTFHNTLLHEPGFFQAWNGTVTAGATLVEATQHSRTFTGGIRLARAIPGESWLDARNRTTLEFSAAYGTVTQPSATLKTASITRPRNGTSTSAAGCSRSAS